MNRDAAIRSLRAVEEDVVAARFALAATLRSVEADPTALQQEVSHAHLRRAAAGLEGTYLVRMFSAFEYAVREYWATLRSTKPQLKPLLDRVGARTYMRWEWLDGAQAAREERNSVVHGGGTRPRVPFTECRQHLCRILSALPREW